MLIFSTDTEIDIDYFNQLKPYIANAYHLDYNKEERSTRVTNEYFWNGLAEVKR